MTIREIIAEIQYKLTRNQQSHYDFPDCQRLVDKQTEALSTAIKALELSVKYRDKAANRWAAQYQATPGSTRFKRGTWDR